MINPIVLPVLLGLNLLLLGLLYVFGVPRAHAVLMQRSSGKNYNKEYAPKSGRKNGLKIPTLEFIGRKSQPSWPTDHAWLEPLWRHRIRSVRLFGIVHMLGVGIVTTIAIVGGQCYSGRQCGSGYLLDRATDTLATALVLATLLYFFTHVRPRLGRGFRSASFLLSAGIVILWIVWAWLVAGLSPGESLYLAWLIYALVWLLLLGAPVVLRKLRWRKRLNLRMNLLVLRVFGSYRRSLFIFKVLQPLWNHVGGVFTVSSPDQGFRGFKSMSKFRLLAFIVLWLLLLIAQATALGLLKDSQALQWALIVVLPFIAHALLYRKPLVWVVDSSFMKDESDTYTPIVKNINKTNRMGVHANTHIACHADDWKLAVESFASMSDCLLIDLRGFTTANAGLAYELGFVVNNIPLENVLGLADKTTDLDAVEKCFADQWSHMIRKSVNYQAGKRTFQIYQRDKIKSRDAFHLAAWLLSKSIRRDLLGRAKQELEEERNAIPVVRWDRKQGGDAWMLLTWLPGNHPGFKQCPHGDIRNWQQLVDESIRLPFTITTRTLGAKENEAEFWKKMAEVVAEVNDEL